MPRAQVEVWPYRRPSKGEGDMRLVVIAAGLVALAIGGQAAAKGSGGGTHTVSGYVKKDGTYVTPHVQTNPNGTKNDNWSTRGNVNPITGEPGTKPRDEDAVKPKPPPKPY